MKQVEYRKNIPPAQNVNVKCESYLQFRPHLISTEARIPFFVFFFLSLVFWTAILDFCGGFRWQLVPRLPFPAPRSPLPVPRFSNILSKTVPRAEIFWERPLIFVWTYENEGFWIRWCHPSYSVYPETDAIVFVLFKRFCVDWQKGFEYATCERAFFRKQRKNHPSSKKV